ncbi:MAG: hypothetical protein ACI9R3_000151 [Verrucomicrobiales bacterium]|jgi:hypothetical protein
MMRQKLKMVHSSIWMLVLGIGLSVTATASAQQESEPFIENLRQRNEVTSRAIEGSPFGGLLGVFRGDHLEGSGKRGLSPLFSRGQQRQQTQQQPRRQAVPEKTRLSLRNPLEGKLPWKKKAQPTGWQQRQAQQQQRIVQRPAPQVQQQRVAPSVTKENPFNRLFAGLKQRKEVRSAPAPIPNRWSAPRQKEEKSGGLFAFLRKGKAEKVVEEDWSREVQRRTNVRTTSSQVELASLNQNPTSSGNALSRWVKSKPFNSWMGMSKEETPAPAPAPVVRQQRPAPVAAQRQTSEQRYVKSDRTGFHAAGRKVNSNSPDMYLSKGTTVQVTNRGWNWSNVVLSDGRTGTIQSSRLSRSVVSATPPRSAARKLVASTSKPKSKPESTKRSSTPAISREAEIDLLDDPLGGLSNMNLPKRTKKQNSKQDDNLSRAALDAVLEPSLESLLDPGVAATLRELEDELLLPLPPEFPEDADTGVGGLPPLN